MKQRIAFDPSLAISAEEFIDAWNRSEHSADASASLDTAPPETFLPMEVAVVLISAAVSIPATVIANFLSGYLQKKFIDKRSPRTTVTTIESPSGEPVLVIKQVEEG